MKVRPAAYPFFRFNVPGCSRVSVGRLATRALLVWTIVGATPLPSARAAAVGNSTADVVASPPAGGLFFGQAPDPQKCRRYFVAAEPVSWDYTPTGKDDMCGGPLPLALPGDKREVSKLRYLQYTDASFTTKVIETPSLGILGPVLRGVVGDFLVVTFLNRTGQPLSMHPHGVRYDKDSEGAFYQPAPGKGASVAPGATFTYVWQLDEASGPSPAEPSSKGWLYHSHVAGDDEINEGLVGVILVTDPERARPDGTPADVDRELATLFLIFDESGLGAEAREAYEYVDNGSGRPTKTWAETQEILEIGGRATINGRLFANLAGLEMNEGERVRWYLFGLGSERDFHTAHWHGHRVIEEGRRRTDVVELLPASMKVADLVADNVGSWLFHCHVADHMREGMFARMTVHARDSVRAADRSPHATFLGLPNAARSVIFQRAIALLDPAGVKTRHGGAPGGEIRLRGTVTVFDAFSVFTQPVRLQIGGHAITFEPDRNGSAQADGSTLEIKNASRTGVIYGGLMDFEIVLRGAAWFGELKKLGLPSLSAGTPTASEPVALPISMSIGQATHAGTAQLAVRTRDN